MENLKKIRWKQRFENFEKSYKLLSFYVDKKLESDIEKAGLIQFFENTFELSWKLMKDYLESLGFEPKSPRDTIKTAFQNGLIEDGHIWLSALADRNLTTHTYDEEFANKMVEEIISIYFLEMKKLYEKLLKKLSEEEE